jgi:hypothetical protein
MRAGLVSITALRLFQNTAAACSHPHVNQNILNFFHLDKNVRTFDPSAHDGIK